MIGKKCFGCISTVALVVCFPLSGVVGFSMNLDSDEEISTPLFHLSLSDALNTRIMKCYSTDFLGKGKENFIPFSPDHEDATLAQAYALYDSLNDLQHGQLRHVVSLFLRANNVEVKNALSVIINDVNGLDSFNQIVPRYRDSLEQHVCITFFPFFRGCIFLLIYLILTYLKNN